MTSSHVDLVIRAQAARGSLTAVARRPAHSLRVRSFPMRDSIKFSGDRELSGEAPMP